MSESELNEDDFNTEHSSIPVKMCNLHCTVRIHKIKLDTSVYIEKSVTHYILLLVMYSDV